MGPAEFGQPRDSSESGENRRPASRTLLDLANPTRDHSFEAMCEPDLPAALDETEVVGTLHRLNALYMGAFCQSDAAWFSEHLACDFVCTLADGRRINKTEFLRRIEETSGVKGVSSDEIDVRPLGDVAVVQGVMHCAADTAPALNRYTHVWRFCGGRWQAVVAHVTHVAGG
jgi:ketosteroid isomerase-like protein